MSKKILISKEAPLLFLCGPCVIEGEKELLYAAETLKEIFAAQNIPFVFKSSYDKANRSSIHSYRGPGMTDGLRLLQKVKKEFDLPLMTDVHSPEEAMITGEICDIIQIPAFLCRQTDLLVAAAKTPAIVNVKKGQFLAPWDMKNIVEKLLECGKDDIILTERGFSFGYNNLVSDMRSIPIMQRLGFPVCFDATHSVQLPGGAGTFSGGQREFIPTLAKSAIAAGCDVIYMEAHPNPENAKSDSQCMISFDDLPKLIGELSRLYTHINDYAHAH